MKWPDDFIGKVIQGDCLDVMREMPAGAIDLVVMDPPYQINTTSAGAGKLNPWADLCNSAFWFSEVYSQIKRIIGPRGAMWTFMNWRSLPTIQKASFDADWMITSLLVWDKQWIGTGGTQGLRPSYELVALMCGEEFSIKNRGIPDIRRAKWSSKKPTGHPAEKPLDLVEWIINISGGGLVFDPFAGSGTSLVAAEKNGYRWCGVELNPKYVEMARKRIAAEQAQGKLF